VRQRFSIAHEIGHWVLERAPVTHDLAPIAHRGRAYDELERVCDYFAASLLMPRRWMQHFVAEVRTAGELGKFFDVSVPAMSARMRELYLATQRGRLK
jgi:Zn-dependent peptidase ImmA (M78 family)